MKFVLNLFFVFSFYGLFGQNIFQLDQNTWNFTVPTDYIILYENQETAYLNFENNYSLISIAKDIDFGVNTLSATFGESENMKKLTTEVYVFSLVDLYKKSYNNSDFSAEVEMERKKFGDRVFYLIRSTIKHLETEYTYISDVYISEFNKKEFMLVLTYDNDDDKQILENSFLNSKFS